MALWFSKSYEILSLATNIKIENSTYQSIIKYSSSSFCFWKKIYINHHGRNTNSKLQKGRASRFTVKAKQNSHPLLSWSQASFRWMEAKGKRKKYRKDNRARIRWVNFTKHMLKLQERKAVWEQDVHKHWISMGRGSFCIRSTWFHQGTRDHKVNSWEW